MGKWAKYLKHYNTKWEKEANLKNWLAPASEDDVANGKPEAYCKLCNTHIRAHHNDLIVHANRAKYKEKEKALNKKEQPNLHDYGIVVTDDVKITELKLSVFVSLHCSIKTVDHLGTLLKMLGKDSNMKNIKLHRTKCFKLISNVVAPVQLADLIKDVGDSPYALIIDESTDVSTTKFMGLCIRYFSKVHKKMITDFLGIVKVVTCTGEQLATDLVNYLKSIGLPINQLHAIGTDGAANMCGKENSMYTHLKKLVPNLQLIKCVCHSIDKCAEYAFKALPNQLTYILNETHNWFCHSAKRQEEYAEFFKARSEGKAPQKLQSLSRTRWLVWLPVSSIIVNQWYDLREYFTREASVNPTELRLNNLSNLYNDDANLLYLTFLKSTLKDVDRMNLAFEHTNADITKLYGDLRNLVFSIAKRVIKERAIAETYNPGTLRLDEVEMLQSALNSSANLIPIDQVKFGESFSQLSKTLQISQRSLSTVLSNCGNYLLILCRQLLDRMPVNIEVIDKIKNFSPKLVLSKIGRPTFDQLPLDLDQSADTDLLEKQWQSLGVLNLTDICWHSPENQNVNSIDIEHFWACVLDISNSIGQYPFKELALFALRCITLPVSNAVVERLFSFMNNIKDKKRNKLQLAMLDSLLRLCVHLKVFNKCCTNFEVSKEMLNRFNSKIYQNANEQNTEEIHVIQDTEMEEELPEEEYRNLMDLFQNHFEQCSTAAGATFF